MEKTKTYTYFGIESNGVIGNRGLVANENGDFDPDYITERLGIKPFKFWKKGDFRKNRTQYMFSSWDAERSEINRLDVEAQCMDTIKNLKGKIEILKEIKEKFDVNYVIVVVPYIYGEEQPIIYFNKEIIEFCYITGTTINMDMYIFKEDDKG
ncbi:DUF4279 domain-containing protein [Fusibacter paucivorans]|uniref:DUF4279 domain-containing protein n=1 Tax=Fusibacter paucivorans TaxID=76009 RepID=A0ABS5PUB8_9FIRM|nr:DUF4279 domain-containing protein [Fusibacter paucivorans]MBS7527627.1 DUF4279 domain-containing protein [Fusibacter paucivorans]